MLGFLGNIYNKLLKRSFINKILFANVIIFATTLSMLSFIISSNISDMLIKKEVKFNTQILNIVDDYYKQKQHSSMELFKRMYLQSASHYPVISFIRNDFDVFTIDNITAKMAFDDFVTSGFSFDNDIRSINIYKKVDKTLVTASRSKSPIQETLPPGTAPPHLDDEKSMGIKVSSGKLFNTAFVSDRQYTFSANIMDEWLKQNIGVIMVNYDSTAIEKAYAQYKQDIKGYILVLTADGDVIFDSSGNYYGKKYPYFNTLRASNGKAKLDKVSIINTKISDADSIIIAGIIPEDELLKDISKTKETIYLIAALCLLLTLILTYIGTNIFTKRIRIIKSAMKTLRKGDLSIRIPESKEEDELAEISSSFNRMSSELEDYINKVYVANLKQKNAELSALQSQINPHFLYNTLESIRMRAITDGNTDVGDMIYLLATFFRGTIKQEMIIDIRDELKYCRMYLELFNIRYDGNLAVTFDIDECIYEYGIVKHMLQPLVENYVIHGYDADKDDNSIIIKGYLKESDIYMEIEDNGRGIDTDKLNFIKQCLSSSEKLSDSIGLTNVNERIKMIYGEGYGLSVSSIINKGTKLVVKLGAKNRKELLSYVQGNDS